MDVVKGCVVEWVSYSQINSYGLSRGCNEIEELSDGVLLFELMFKVYCLCRSPSVFDMKGVFSKPGLAWPLKLSNVKKLKDRLDDYIADELGLGIRYFSEIGVSTIARLSKTEDILRLTEEVIYAVIHCPIKEEFIMKMRELDPEVQMGLKSIIERTIAANENSIERVSIEITGFDDTEDIQKCEEEKEKLLAIIHELESENKKLSNVNGDLLRSQSEVSAQVVDCKDECETYIKSKSALVVETVYDELKKEEWQLIEEFKDRFRKMEKKHEAEVNRLKDDLDVAYSMCENASELENKNRVYKQKLEILPFLKKINKELIDENADLKISSEHLKKLGAQTGVLKEQVEKYKLEAFKEQQRAEGANAILATKDLETSKLTKKVSELEEMKLDFLMEIKSLQNQLYAEESELGSPLLPEEFMQLPVLSRTNTIDHVSDELRKMNNTINNQQEEINDLSYQLGTNAEEYQQLVREKESIINTLMKETDELNSQIAHYESKLDGLELEKSKGQQFRQSIAELKSDRNRLKEFNRLKQGEIQSLTEELEKRKAENRDLYEKIHENEKIIRTNEITYKNTINSLIEKKNTLESFIETSKSVESLEEPDTSSLKAEISNLNNKLQNKSLKLNKRKAAAELAESYHAKMIETIHQDCNDKISLSEKQHQEELVKLQHETEAAVLKIHKKHHKLDLPRPKSRILSSQTISELPSENPSEPNQDLVDKLKATNEQLTSEKSELRAAWETAISLLQSVSSQITEETTKLSSATKGKLNSL